MTCTLHAQDVIVLCDATEIESKVLEIRENSIAYKKWDNQEGPVYYLSSDKVFFIKYANGTKDIFNTISPNTPSVKQVSVDTTFIDDSRPFVKDVRFQGYLTSGLYYGDNLCLDLFSLSLGIRLFDYGYVGIKTGFLWDLTATYDLDGVHHFGHIRFRMPVMLDLRGYYPISRTIHPYFEFSPGLEPSLLETGYLSFAYQLGLGFDINHFTFGVGYYSGFGQHNGYLKLGVRLGKTY